jgi:molybdopterin-binding protein
MRALVKVEVACGFPLLAIITTRSAEELNLIVDKRVYATFKVTGTHILRRN